MATSTRTATCPEPFNTTGPRSITASYSGDQNFTASTGSLTETVGQAVTTTTVTSSANPSAVGQTVTYTATVSPVPDGGTVAFSDDGAPIAGCSSRARGHQHRHGHLRDVLQNRGPAPHHR